MNIEDVFNMHDGDVLRVARSYFEKHIIELAGSKTGFHKTRMAEMLGISRPALENKIKKVKANIPSRSQNCTAHIELELYRMKKSERKEFLGCVILFDGKFYRIGEFKSAMVSKVMEHINACNG